MNEFYAIFENYDSDNRLFDSECPLHFTEGVRFVSISESVRSTSTRYVMIFRLSISSRHDVLEGRKPAVEQSSIPNFENHSAGDFGGDKLNDQSTKAASGSVLSGNPPIKVSFWMVT